MYAKHKKAEKGKRKRFRHMNTFQTSASPDIKVEADVNRKSEEETPHELGGNEAARSGAEYHRLQCHDKHVREEPAATASAGAL